jgi:hypothetical protein
MKDTSSYHINAGNKMNDIEILRKAIKRKHPCDESHEALKRIEEEIKRLKTALDTANAYLDVFWDEENEK